MVTSAFARRQVPTISPSTSTAPGQTRTSERGTLRGVGDQELAVGALQQEVGVAARQETRGGRGRRRLAERRLVALKIQASPIGVRTGVSVPSASNAKRA